MISAPFCALHGFFIPIYNKTSFVSKELYQENNWKLWEVRIDFWDHQYPTQPLIIAAPKGSGSIKRIPRRLLQTHLFASQYFDSIFNLQFISLNLQFSIRI